MNQSSMGVSGFDGEHLRLVREGAGIAPSETIVTTNPAFDRWVEKAALILCCEAGEAGVIPTPCFDHLHEARQIGTTMHMRITNGASEHTGSSGAVG